MSFNDIFSEDAVREKLILACQIVGASGAGKTVGALMLAYGMMKAKYPEESEAFVWSKIGLVDTEHERSLVTVGMVYNGVRVGSFKVVKLRAPYSIERYDYSVKHLVNKDKVEVVIIDSATHAWEGEGGVLDYQQKIGGRFQDWNETNKKTYNPLITLLTGERHGVHTISTSRAKQEYIMEPDEVGKMQVVKKGLKPVQRDTLEYEMQVVFRIDMEHKFYMSKDNSTLFNEISNETLKPEYGELLYKWLDEGVDIFAEREAEAQRLEEERLHLANEIKDLAKKFELMEWVTEMEKHPSVGVVEQASLAVLRNMRKALQAKMEEKENIKSKINK